MSVRLMFATAAVKARSYWTCSCGAKAQGSTVEFGLEDDKVGRPAVTFDQSLNRQVAARHMPVGWASYGNGKYLCGACAK